MNVDYINHDWTKQQADSVVNQIAKEIYTAFSTSFSEDFSWTEEKIRVSLDNKFHHFFFMRDQSTKEMVAVAHFQRLFEEVDLMNIAVIPKYRGQKLSQGLLGYALNHFEATGAETVTLEVRSRNQVARNLYEGLNFKQIASRANYYQINLDDAIIYQLALNHKESN